MEESNPSKTNTRKRTGSRNQSNPPPVISVDTLNTPVDSVNVPPPPAPTPVTSTTADATATNANVTMNQPEPKPTDGKSLLERFGLTAPTTPEAPGSLEDAYKSATSGKDLAEKKARASQLSNELIKMDKDFRDEVAQIRKNTQGGYGGATEDQVRLAQDRYQNNRANASIAYNTALGDYEAVRSEVDNLFQVKSKDIENQYNYKKSLYDTALNLATEDQKRELALADKANDRTYQEQQNAVTLGNQIALEAAKNGAGASVLSAIISAASGKGANMGSILSAAGSYVRPPSSPKLIPTQVVDGSDGKKYLINTQTGETIREITGTEQTSDISSTELSTNISRVNSLLSDTSSLSAATGQVKGKKSFLASLYNPLTLVGGGYTEKANNFDDFLSKSGKIINDQTFTKLTQLKQGGATFGSLTEGERIAIGKAASDFAAAAEFDSQGNVTGFRGSEKQIKENLKLIQKGYLQEQDIINAKTLGSEDLLDIININ